MTQALVVFTGISGVGKTTFLRKLQRFIAFQHLTGGSLIAAARGVADESRDDLRNADLDENQRLLIQGLSIKRDPGAPLVIMDGHVVIDRAGEVQSIPAAVFERLGITLMVHLEADPLRVSQNRDRDKGRERPMHAVEVLAAHQERSRTHALSIASTLNVGFISVHHDDERSLADTLKTQTQNR